jgi:hypothetical protein
MVLGVTLSDAAIFLPPWNDLSFGMPNNWGAAALVFALIEGLAGVKDTGVAYDTALIAPRWASADVKHAEVSVRYPASRGYVRYRYHYDEASRRITLEFTGNTAQTEIAVLLPEDKKVRAAKVKDQPVNIRIEEIQNSRYVHLQIQGRGVHRINLQLE